VRASKLKPKRIYAPRIISDHIMLQEDFERLHKFLLEIEGLSEVSDDMRELVEDEWPELVHKLPARSLSRASRSTWSSDAARHPTGGTPSCVTTHRTSPPWTCLLFQQCPRNRPVGAQRSCLDQRHNRRGNRRESRFQRLLGSEID
jgi:hypothetical protein